MKTFRIKPDRRNFELHERWKNVPRGTMDEVSSYVRLDPPFLQRQGRPRDCSASSSDPMVERPRCRFRREARARERHRHRIMDSLKVLDPEGPIREADIVGPIAGSEISRTITELAPRRYHSKSATARVQPADAPLILCGKQATVNPFGGNWSRLHSFSM